MPARSRKVAVVAHCHLNVNTKVHGLADYRGAREDLVSDFVSSGIGIVQLPCPEATFLGMSRWGMTYEQYDTPAYRRHCREILGPTLDTLVALAADGCEIVGIYGVAGSPSCGVDVTCMGYGDGGEIEDLAATGLPRSTLSTGRGVFFEELASILRQADLDVRLQDVRGVDADPAD
jgi:predicted secreted protein